MLKAIKIRLYLNINQKQKINSLLGSYRFVYNQCLDFKQFNYIHNKQNISLSVLERYFHQNLRNKYVWLKEHNTKVLEQSIINLDRAYKNFFKLHRSFPKFKSKREEQKVRFPRGAISLKTFDEGYSKLNLTKTIKGLKFRCSDRDKQYLYLHKDLIRSVTISRTKSEKYFASILIKNEILKEVECSNRIIGIDLGIKKLMVFSDGEIVENPKWIRSNEVKLKRLYKQLNKKQRGSKNRNKTRLKLARFHEKIKNQKQNFIHNITSKIINENQIIILEDLNIKGMLRNHNLAKSIHELGLYEIRRQLEYKSKWYNREFILVDRWFPSSKICCKCEWKNNYLTLKDRVFICGRCGNTIDRDLNAAINIKKEGIKLHNKIGQYLPEFKLVDYPTMDEPNRDVMLKSSDRLKQEDRTYKGFSIG